MKKKKMKNTDKNNKCKKTKTKTSKINSETLLLQPNKSFLNICFIQIHDFNNLIFYANLNNFYF